MPKNKKDNTAELLRLAITGLDNQIAELQEIQTQLSAMVGRPSASGGATKASKTLGRGEGENQRRRESSLGKRQKGESEGPKGETGA